MITTFRFYKDYKNEWFLDLPQWTGPKEQLEMVEGADTLLNKISDFGEECYLRMSDEQFENAEVLILKKKRTEIEGGGGDYLLQQYNGKEINHNLWLCDVTEFIFNTIPDYIYFRKQQKILKKEDNI
jgi:hypothetical protein